MTVRTCICNVFKCDIHCKIYTYLLHLCYIHCMLRCWTFVTRLHRFLLLKSVFPWIGHSATCFNSFHLFKLILYQNWLIWGYHYRLSIKFYDILIFTKIHEKRDVLSRLALHCNSIQNTKTRCKWSSFLLLEL